jgi:hypothetical protein
LALHYAVFAFFCIAIALRNLSYSACSKRWTERLFLVTHCLSASYKGSIRQSDSLCRTNDPQVSAQTQELRVRFSLYFLTLGGWIFVAKM